MKRSVALVLFALTGLAATPGAADEKPWKIAFKPEAVAWSLGSGTGSVEGASSLNIAGRVVSCFNTNVRLFASAEFSDRYMTALFGANDGGITPSGRAKVSDWPLEVRRASGRGKWEKTWRSALCDERGNFRFSELPVGNYWVEIDYSSPPPGGSRPAPQNIGWSMQGMGTVATGPIYRVSKRISVSDGQVTSVTLNFDVKE